MMILFVSILAISLAACSTAKLNVVPDKTVLSPALIKKSPIAFNGSGWEPEELVIIELILPEGFKMKGLNEDEGRVGIATATADKNGDFKTKMSPVATMNWFFQVAWEQPNPDSLARPNFKKIRPLRPGKYELVATGTESEKKGTAILEFLAPPKKK